MDDIIVMGASKKDVFAVMGELSSHFDVANLGNLGSFLVLTFIIDSNGA